MTREIKIGASISSRSDASLSVDDVFVASEFPRNLTIQNHAAFRLVLPELKAMDIAPLTSREAHFKDLGTLKRVVSSLAQISRLQSFDLLATVYAVEPVQEPETPVEPEPQATVTTEPEPQATETTEATSTQPDDGQVYAVLVAELEGGYIRVAVGDVQFDIRNTQLREDGSLTAGGLTAYETALNTTNE